MNIRFDVKAGKVGEKRKCKKMKKVVDKRGRCAYNKTCAVRRQTFIKINNPGEILKRLKRRPC